jgi:hypothetical protein
MPTVVYCSRIGTSRNDIHTSKYCLYIAQLLWDVHLTNIISPSVHSSNDRRHTGPPYVRVSIDLELVYPGTICPIYAASGLQMSCALVRCSRGQGAHHSLTAKVICSPHNRRRQPSHGSPYDATQAATTGNAPPISCHINADLIIDASQGEYITCLETGLMAVGDPYNVPLKDM